MSSTHTLLEWRTNQLTATEVLAETIVLHSLCENCTTYFLQWKALEWARNWGERRSQEWQYSSSLCSVAQLVTSQRQCHFCTLILAALDRSPFTKREKVLDMNVYLRFQDNRRAMKREGSVGISCSIAIFVCHMHCSYLHRVWEILHNAQCPNKEPSPPTSHLPKSPSTPETISALRNAGSKPVLSTTLRVTLSR
jgi:hypothetical protein